MASELFKESKEAFTKNMESVMQLLHFDRIILDLCISHIENLEYALKNNTEIKLTSAHFLPTKTIKLLKDIRINDSLRNQYQEMFNQGLVLAVSHFSSTLHSIFKEAINQASSHCPELLTATGEDIKISFEELKNYNFNLTTGLGDLVIRKKDISFQDMQSIHRAFKNFFNLDIEKDEITNNIILAQAARHSIVHAQSKIDEKFLKQTKDANPRAFKDSLIENEQIQFHPSEIECVITSMNAYVERLINQLSERMRETSSN